MLTLKDDRLIGWLKKGVLTEREVKFVESVYGEKELTHNQWRELSRINKRVGKL